METEKVAWTIFAERVIASDINKKSTDNWLRRANLKVQTEAFMSTAQDQALQIYNYEEAILKVRQDDKC